MYGETTEQKNGLEMDGLTKGTDRRAEKDEKMSERKI